MQSALVLGGDSLIGSALSAHLIANSWKVKCTTRRTAMPLGWVHFDLKYGFDALIQSNAQHADVVFICGAVTGFVPCDQDPIATRYVNVKCTVELARRFMQQGSRVVYLSSNAVFDGSRSSLDEFASTSPKTEYGRQKADCEQELLSCSAGLPGSCAIVRLTKVVEKKQTIYSGWIQNLKTNKPVKAAVDLMLCPMTTAFVAVGLQSIGADGKTGVFHLSGEKDMSYFDLATAMATLLGKDALVERVWVRDRLGIVPAPNFSSLSMTLTTSAYGIRPQCLIEVARELTRQGNSLVNAP